MEDPVHSTTPSDTSHQVGATIAAGGQHIRGRLLGVIAAPSLAILAILAAVFSSTLALAPPSEEPGGLLGARALTIVTAMLVLGGAFVILRAAISHDECARRVDGLCRQLESSHTRLRELSFTDDVTGLYNRRFFAMRLDDEVSRYSRFNRPLSVVMLDVDDFEAVHDDLGREAGDETLRTVGHVLQRQSRSMDVVSRYGGDAFAVLLVETGKDGALLYAERVRREVEAAAFGHGRAITVSLGVACLPDDVEPVPEDIVTASDWALGEAKRAGKNQVAGQAGAVAIGRGRRGGWDL
jgi:diguanylate cyclase (GGDEF)-like protein